MLDIKYSFSNSDQYTNYKTADDTSLRYSLFLGSLILQKDSSRIRLNWEWIPLLDFAVCFLSIYLELLGKRNLKKIFEFTESDGQLFIERVDDRISISTSFSDEKIEMSFNDFSIGIKAFYLNIMQEIKNKYDGIELNEFFLVYDFKKNAR